MERKKSVKLFNRLVIVYTFFQYIVAYGSFILILVFIYYISIGQLVRYEFAHCSEAHVFKNIMMEGLPFAVLLTLFGTIKRKNSSSKNWAITGATALVCVISFFIVFLTTFTIGFGAWITESILYKHKQSNKIICEQLYDIGAFGYGGRRIVEIKPVFNYWILPTPVDTAKINKNDWIFVNEGGELK